MGTGQKSAHSQRRAIRGKNDEMRKCEEMYGICWLKIYYP